MERLSLHIRGRVQGVSYRASARATATGLGLTGWVRNRTDGGVTLVAEGPRAQLDELLAWCRKGPTLARVDAVEPDWAPATGEFERFEIRR
jgi:acylphosphatase